ncbi:unnamed protein product [Caenorhabditis brenneri]
MNVTQMEPFPLFKLPYLAFKHVIVRFDFIIFAMCSAKCYQIVKAMKLKVRRLTIEYSQHKQGLSLEFRRYFMCYWYFKISNIHELNNCEEKSRLNRNTFPLQISCDPDGHNIAGVEYLVTFVTDLFQIEHVCYQMNANGFTNFQEYFSDRIVNRKLICDHLIFSAWVPEGRFNFAEYLNNEDVYFILDNLPDDIEITFTGLFSDDFEYKKLLTQKKINTDSDILMTSEQFLNSKFQKLTLRYSYRFTLDVVEIT